MSLQVILYLLAAVYASRIVFFSIGIVRERRRWKPNALYPMVSVVVPARNEAQNIVRCITSILATSYPRESLEVIVVDDRSTDQTAERVQTLAATDSRLTLLKRTEHDVTGSLKGKAGALQYGVDRCSGDIVLFTDADCAVSKDWIHGMTAQFADERLGLITGLTSVVGDSFFQRIQDVEWTYTQAMACGGVGNGIPLGCFGNNMAIRKRVFDELGGYGAIGFSVTEDLALQLAVDNAGYHVRYAINPSVHVETLPCNSFGEYAVQRHRWVRGGRALGKRAVAFVASSLALWAGIVISAVESAWIPFWSFVAMRVVGDSILVAIAANYLGRTRLFTAMIPAIIFLVLTELSLPMLFMRKSVRWKGQVFRS